MQVEITILSKGNHKEKDKYHMISLVYEIQNTTQLSLSTKQKQTQETQVQFLGQEVPLEKEMSTHQYSCLEKSMDRGASQATVPGITKSRTQLKIAFRAHLGNTV